MPKMTKSKIAATIAEKVGLKKKQVGLFLDELTQLAYKEAKNSFVVPGLGKLILATRTARQVVMRFGPKAGQTIKVPAKKVVKFRLSKAAKEQILSSK